MILQNNVLNTYIHQICLTKLSSPRSVIGHLRCDLHFNRLNPNLWPNLTRWFDPSIISFDPFQWNLVCENSFYSSLISSLSLFGLLVGAITFGYLADIIGEFVHCGGLMNQTVQIVRTWTCPWTQKVAYNLKKEGVMHFSYVHLVQLSSVLSLLWLV